MMITSHDIGETVLQNIPPPYLRSATHAELQLRIAERHIAKAITAIRKVARTDISHTLAMLTALASVQHNIDANLKG